MRHEGRAQRAPRPSTSIGNVGQSKPFGEASLEEVTMDAPQAASVCQFAFRFFINGRLVGGKQQFRATNALRACWSGREASKAASPHPPTDCPAPIAMRNSHQRKNKRNYSTLTTVSFTAVQPRCTRGHFHIHLRRHSLNSKSCLFTILFASFDFALLVSYFNIACRNGPFPELELAVASVSSSETRNRSSSVPPNAM